MSAVSVSQAGPVLRNGSSSARLLGITLAFCLICVPLFSQTTQGTIQGTVFDQSGGAIAGGMVTVIDVARGVSRTLTADSAGEYVATNLTPGTYTVRAEAKGFQTQEHSGDFGAGGRKHSCRPYTVARRANPDGDRDRRSPVDQYHRRYPGRGRHQSVH